MGSDWLSQVTFQFGDPKDMLDKLADLPAGIHSQIRHLRIYGASLKLTSEDGESYFRTAQALKLLPNLQLDVLTVIGDNLPNCASDTLNMLIRFGGGWKELHFFTFDSNLLGYADKMRYLGLHDDMNNRYMRLPQPADWQETMNQRDGEASKPAVIVYRSKDSSTRGSVFQPDKREVMVQAFGPDQDAQTYGRAEDPDLMRPGEVEKEILVVVKRGQGVDCAEKEVPTYVGVYDIRWSFDMRTWKEIKAYQEELFDDSDDEGSVE